MSGGTCSVEGCDRAHSCRGWCTLHYDRWWRHGDPLTTKLIADPVLRFWQRIDRSPSNGCWLWVGQISSDGYGRLRVNGRDTPAHRFAYELLVGPIPEGLVLDHVVCDNRPCVNPAHLNPTTAVANVMRSPKALAAINARKTHCKHGHEFTPENTYKSRGARICRTCSLRRTAEAYQRRKAQAQ